MWIESWFQNEQDKKKKEISEKELKNNEIKKLEHKKVKEKISVEIETEEELNKLKDLIDKWIISKDTAEKIVEWENIDKEIIEEIFDKINQIDEIKDIDKYLPKELRVSKEDYSKALNDDIFRLQLITRLDSSLALISNKINPDSSMWLNLFTWFITILDKNLILIQENTIDVKNSLKEVDKKKNHKNTDKKTFFQKIIDFIKEIIN